jgi:hypothetical protein
MTLVRGIRIGEVVATDLDTDWEQRSTAAGVTMATRFETQAERDDYMHPDGAEADSQRLSSGRGSGYALRITAEAYKTQSGKALWRRLLDDDWTTDEEGVGTSHRYISMLMRCNEYRLVNPRHPGGSSWKNFIIANHSIEGEVGAAASSTLTSLVVTDQEYTSVISSYAHDNVLTNGRPFLEDFAGGGFNYQPGMDNDTGASPTLADGQRYCLVGHASSTEGPYDNVSVGCELYVPDEWLAIQVHWRIGSYGRDSGQLNQSPTPTVVSFDIGNSKVNWTSHGMLDGDRCRFFTNGTLPTGITDYDLTATRYYVVNATSNDFQVSATAGGSAITFSGTQAGNHRVNSNGRAGNEWDLWIARPGDTEWKLVFTKPDFETGSKENSFNGHNALWLTVNETDDRFPSGTVDDSAYTTGSHPIGATVISIDGALSSGTFFVGDVIKAVGLTPSDPNLYLVKAGANASGSPTPQITIEQTGSPWTDVGSPTGGLVRAWDAGTQLRTVYAINGVPEDSNFDYTEIICGTQMQDVPAWP